MQIIDQETETKRYYKESEARRQATGRQTDTMMIRKDGQTVRRQRQRRMQRQIIRIQRQRQLIKRHIKAVYRDAHTRAETHDKETKAETTTDNMETVHQRQITLTADKETDGDRDRHRKRDRDSYKKMYARHRLSIFKHNNNEGPHRGDRQRACTHETEKGTVAATHTPQETDTSTHTPQQAGVPTLQGDSTKEEANKRRHCSRLCTA